MRVLLISHTCQSREEGQPRANLIGRAPGIELRVLTPRRWRHYGHWRSAEAPAAAADGVPPAFRLDAGRVRWPWLPGVGWYAHYYPDLADVLRTFRPDVIDLWEEPWGIVSAQACRLRNRLLPEAHVISETEQNIDKRLPWPFESCRRYVLRNASFAIGRSPEAIAVLRNKGYRGPAGVVPNAVDANLFRPLDRAACRAELGLTGFVAGYVGRLVEEKGITDALDALPLCPPDVNLLLVGAGPLHAPLLARARALGVSDRVRTISELPLHSLPRVMNAIDVLLLPSRTTPAWKEQFGRVIIEAHACVTPVVGSDSGAIPYVIGEGGIVFRERDPSDLARALLQMRDAPMERHNLGERGRQQVEERYTWERVADRMAEIYRRVVRGDEGPRSFDGSRRLRPVADRPRKSANPLETAARFLGAPR